MYLLQCSKREKKTAALHILCILPVMSVIDFPTATLDCTATPTRHSCEANAACRYSAGFHVHFRSGKHLKVVFFFLMYWLVYYNQMPPFPISIILNRMQTLVPSNLALREGAWLHRTFNRWLLHCTHGLFSCRPKANQTVKHTAPLPWQRPVWERGQDVST